MKRKSVVALASLILLAASSCSTSSTNAIFQLRLTDSPADYEAVLIDIRDVQISVGGDEEKGWSSLKVNQGVYNLLEFRNGLDTLLVSTELPVGTISQIRLILGENNALVAEGETFPLKAPSSTQSGLKLNVHCELSEGLTYKLWIDFDAARSIVKKGNGSYSLKPVVRTYTEAASGAIKGVVSPAASMPFVLAKAEADTFSVIATEDGRFFLRGIPPGTYGMEFQPVDGFSIRILENIPVTLGEVTDLDTVFIESLVPAKEHKIPVVSER
jgi:hypothetical protein